MRALAARAYWDGLGPLMTRLPPTLGAALPRAAARLARADPGVIAAMSAAFPEAGSAPAEWALEEARLQLRTRLLRLRYPALTQAEVRRDVAVIGAEALDTALARGRGVVLVGAHFGVHALPPLALRLLGWPVQVLRVMKPSAALSPPRAWGQERRRAMEGGLAVPYLDAGRDEAAALAALSDGQAVVIGGDGEAVSEVTGRPDRVAPLLGRSTRWPTHGFTLARVADAALVALLPESHDAGHRLVLRSLDGPDPQAEFIAHYGRWLETYPGQWQLWRERGA